MPTQSCVDLYFICTTLFTAFNYYLIDRFVSINSLSILLGLVCFCLLFNSVRVFQTSISWGYFIGVWVTAFSPGLQDSSQYSDRSQQYCSLDGLDSSSDFWIPQSFFQVFVNRSKCTNYNWYHRSTVHFSSLAMYKNLLIFPFSLIFTRWFTGMAKSTSFLFFFSLFVC